MKLNDKSEQRTGEKYTIESLKLYSSYETIKLIILIFVCYVASIGEWEIYFKYYSEILEEMRTWET